MKILHTADWSLDSKLHGYSRLREQQAFLDWLLQQLVTQSPDVLCIAGNVYANCTPSAAAEALFYDFLNQATMAIDGLQIVVIAGSQEDGARLEAMAVLLRQRRIFLFGTTRLLPDGSIDYQHHIIPLRAVKTDQVEALCVALPMMYTPDLPTDTTIAAGIGKRIHQFYKVATTHRYGHLPRILLAPLPQAYLTDYRLDAWHYMALGGETLQGALQTEDKTKAWYAGNPLQGAFAQAETPHGALSVTLASGGVQVNTLAFPQPSAFKTIPAQGAASVEQVFAAIAKLPNAANSTMPPWQWPFLQLLLATTDTALYRDIQAQLANKAVRCTMVQYAHAESAKPESPTWVQAVNADSPKALVQAYYEHLHQRTMPAELSELLTTACLLLHEQGQTPHTL